MRSQDSATTRLDDYIVDMLPWAHGHQRKAIRDFVRAIIDQQTGCQAQLARSFGNQEAATKRLSRLLHNERLEPRHLESLWKQNLYKTMLWFIYLAKLRTDLLDNRSLAILLETYKLLICYTLVFGQPLSRCGAPTSPRPASGARASPSGSRLDDCRRPAPVGRLPHCGTACCAHLLAGL
jgi:hypothetical protein